MPLIHVKTSAPAPASDDVELLLKELTTTCAERIGKDERWVMVALDCGQRMAFGGSTEPCAFVEVKNIGGYSPELASALCADLCAFADARLGVAPARVYVELEEETRPLFGWNAKTFG